MPLHPFGFLLSSMNSFDRSFPSAIINLWNHKLKTFFDHQPKTFLYHSTPVFISTSCHKQICLSVWANFTFALPHDPKTAPSWTGDLKEKNFLCMIFSDQNTLLSFVTWRTGNITHSKLGRSWMDLARALSIALLFTNLHVGRQLSTWKLYHCITLDLREALSYTANRMRVSEWPLNPWKYIANSSEN